MTDCIIVYSELKAWQPLIGSVLGFGALTWGALYNYSLNRKRDDRIREMERVAVALALYSEIRLLSNDISSLANAIGNWYIKNGYRGNDLPSHFEGSFLLREPALYSALAAKIGLLPSDMLLPISEFYANYGEAKGNFPKIMESESRQISYGPGWVLRPAIDAIDGVQAALRSIETLGDVGSPAPLPDLEKARKALQLEQEMMPD